jgi:MIP family channel proteins
MESTARAAIAESVGTFAVMFFGAGTVVATGGQDLLAIALAYGLAVAIMVSVMGRISGGVFNPAIQTALWVTGKMPSVRSAVYVVAQLAGAVAAAYLLKYLAPGPAFGAVSGGTPAVATGYAVGKAVVVEASLTFFLVWAFFGAVIDDRGPSATTAGFAVGLVVTIDVLVGSSLTGAAMNPARWFGPALATGDWSNWWVWVVGPIAGGIIAGVAYWFLYLSRAEPTTP